MNFDKSTLSTDFIQAMVRSMYRFEASLVNDPELLSGQDLEDFYLSFLGGVA